MGLFDLKKVDAITTELFKAFNNFPTDKVINATNEGIKKLSSELDKFSKQIKSTFDKWSFEVDCDITKDIITSKIVDNVLTVHVVNSTIQNGTSTQTFSTTIPDDVDVESMRQIYNKENKKVLFSFSKKQL